MVVREGVWLPSVPYLLCTSGTAQFQKVMPLPVWEVTPIKKVQLHFHGHIYGVNTCSRKKFTSSTKEVGGRVCVPKCYPTCSLENLLVLVVNNGYIVTKKKKKKQSKTKKNE